MLKIEHISKTFNPGTVPMELVNPLCLMQSVEIFLQIPV